MRIALTRTGGFGGLRQALSLEGAQLTKGEQAELRRLLSRAGFWSLPAALPAAPPAPDRLRYRLVIEDGARRHEVRTAEEAMPEPLRALVRWVEARAREG